MLWPDAVNATFLVGGGTLIWMNVYRAWKDKMVTGVSVWPSVWFATWGVWDCYYFPHLGQWLSLVGSIWAVAPNATWLYLYWRYRNGRTLGPQH